MNLPLRLLAVLHDAEAELILPAVERAGFDARNISPSQAAALSEALAQGKWDFVLAPPAVLDGLAPPGDDTRQLQAALVEQREQMRGLNSRLNEIEESVRRRLSAELHDRVGQSLTTLGLTLSLARNTLLSAGSAVSAGVVPRLEQALAVTDEMSEQVRDVMGELRPPQLDDYGLLAALRWHAARFAETAGLPTEVQGQELNPRLPLIVETALFRISQEALTNILRHAQARQVTLRLGPVPDTNAARLTIADDGRGFSPQRPRPLGERARWGLITMRERAETVGGIMRISSAPGEGTRVTIEVAR